MMFPFHVELLNTSLLVQAFSRKTRVDIFDCMKCYVLVYLQFLFALLVTNIKRHICTCEVVMDEAAV